MPTATHADNGAPGRSPHGADVLLDSSAAVALILEDHDDHARTVAALRGRRLGLAGHAWFETFSVLTRLPAGRRRSPAAASQVLARNFPDTRFLGAQATAELRDQLARMNIAGGSIYDALVAAAARQFHLPLVSLDARAKPVYDALQVAVEIIA